MRSPLAKTATVLIMLGLLLPGAMVMYEVPSASASPTYGRVTVSGANILVDGNMPSEKFYGVVDTTALQFAIMSAAPSFQTTHRRTSGISTLPC